LDLALFAWLLNIGLMLLICFRGAGKEMFKFYPAFFTYITYQSVTNMVQLFVYLTYGYESTHYYYAINWGNLPVPVFHLLIIAEVCKNSGLFRMSATRLLQIFLGIAILVALFTSPPANASTTDWFYRFHAVMLPSQVIACASCYSCFILRREVQLGWNLEGILLGISILLVGESITFVQFIYSDISFAVFRILVPATATMMLTVFAVALWEKTEVRVRGLAPASSGLEKSEIPAGTLRARLDR
jgi:hypothetical protein